MSSLYYVFEDEQTAIGAEAAISQLGGAPITGVNAKTGLPAPDECKTERWAIPQERLDGKWVFLKVPTSIVDEYSQEVIDAFNADYPNTLEEYNSDWFPQEEA